jgi:hypothetical protein
MEDLIDCFGINELDFLPYAGLRRKISIPLCAKGPSIRVPGKKSHLVLPGRSIR